MPELPEVETVVRGLAQSVTGDVIESVWLGSKPEPLKSPPAEIARTLKHARIARVHRMGKHIVFDLEKSGRQTKPARPPAGRTKPLGVHHWIVHLGMTGTLLVCTPAAEVEKHTHAIIRLASGRE